MEKEHLPKQSLIDECMGAFKSEGVSFTRFGKRKGSKGMIFELPFAEEGSMLVHLFETDKDTVGGYLFDIIPYRYIDEEIREKILQLVNTHMNEKILFYNESIHRFYTPVEMSRSQEKEPYKAEDIIDFFSKLGERILSCFV